MFHYLKSFLLKCRELDKISRQVTKKHEAEVKKICPKIQRNAALVAQHKECMGKSCFAACVLTKYQRTGKCINY